MLKVAASPQMIESVLSTFLPQYAVRFPNVQVRLTEALGPAQVALLERGEVDLGIRHDQGVDPHLKSLALQPDEVLAACAPSLYSLAQPKRLISAALHPYPLLLLEPGYSVRVNSMRLAVWQISNPISCSKAVRPTPCLRSRKLDTVLQSFRRSCGRIAMS